MTTTPEKDGAPQAWAVEIAKQIWETTYRGGEYTCEEFVTDGYAFHEDMTAAFARALQSTREKALREAATLCGHQVFELKTKCGVESWKVGEGMAELIIKLIDQEPKK